MIQGVRATVVHDVLYVNGVRAEDTFDGYAQDKTGNVCYFGEDTRDGAIMLAGQPGDFYQPEFAPGVGEDEATVISRMAASPAGSPRRDRELRHLQRPVRFNRVPADQQVGGGFTVA